MSTARRAAPQSRFTARVYAVVRRIPAGRVATYGDVAALAGAPRAARAVGTILRGCQDPATPCHRVIGAGGALGGWGGPLESKRARDLFLWRPAPTALLALCAATPRRLMR